MIEGRRWLWWLPTAFLVAIIAWFSHQPRWPDALIGYPDWLLHGLAYAAVGAASHLGASEGFRTRGGAVYRVALVVTLLSAAGDELHQGTVPGRDAALTDWLADAVGAGVALCALALLDAFGGLPRRMGQSESAEDAWDSREPD